jgi:uncharacterized protein (TIGR03435 family)
MRGRIAPLLIASLLTVPVMVATQSAPAFEVVSIKPNHSGESGGASRAQPGRYQGINVTLMRLIRLAYQPVQEFEGGPDWINTEHFDIEARAAGTPTRDEMIAMLRVMLADRFALQVRRDVRERPVYALTLARRDGTLGAQLKRSDAECQNGPGTCGVQMDNGALRSKSITLPRLAAELSFVGRKVIDRTGLPGAFDVSLEWMPDAPGGGAPPPDSLPSIFTAIQEQLGLKLEPSTGSVDFVTIVRAERPTPN